MQGQTIPIDLTDELLLLLLRGGTVNYITQGIQIRLKQKEPLVTIKKEQYRELKRYMGVPTMQELIFREIDK